ncbi:hypothetical protein [Streptomyces neyagawaensis]|uniref:hypothetical protein n=1 Tax=Streptomyces neyagawaensis TaxID=42238 RepID=UPI0006E3E4A4|nr:hypothetical protein [Streptomyces neyagawaensis]MCL6739308.1 hypothetical protein [Streptomyces neyagawaensis]MDE1688987.1 hypothetical protein [Streptomyces neyagawaensis]
MTFRKVAAALFAAAAIAVSTVGLDGTAAAHTDSSSGGTGILTSEDARQPSLTAAQMRNAVAPEAAGSGASAAASLNCAYYYVCGKGANGNRFDYTTCNTTYTLPNLVGWGSLHNNQTPGTRAHFYDANGAWMFSIDAPARNDVFWTPVWYVIAC